MNPNSLEEELGNGFYYDTFLVGCQDGHLRELVNKNKYIIVTMLC
jgi:hypothetical protein